MTTGQTQRRAEVRDRIQLALPRMTGSMARVAQVVLDEPTAVVDLTINELAERAGVSAPTISRFCQQIGYSGFTQFRVRMAAEIGVRHDDHLRRNGTAGEATWRLDIGRALRPDDEPEAVLRAVLDADQLSLRATAELVDLEAMLALAERIFGCRHLDVYGIGGSSLPAIDFVGRLYRLGLNAHAFTDVHEGLSSAVLLPENSVAIAISVGGETDDTVAMLAAAKSSGAHAVALTGRDDSPLSRVADQHLQCAVAIPFAEPDYLSTRYGQLFLLDLLYLLITQRDFTAATERLRRSREVVRRRVGTPAMKGAPA